MKLWNQTCHVPKRHTYGQHRSCTPAETLAAWRPAMRVTGITRLANLTGLDPIGLPVFAAIRPGTRSIAVSQGKGIDVDAARVSALMESLEMWHAENAVPQRTASSEALRREVCIADVEQLPRYRPVAPHEELAWTEGYDLMHEAPIWVPFDLVTMDTVDSTESPFLISSDGLASGNHVLEAICHAACEVIERDAEALWALSDDLVEVRLDTVEDPGCRNIIVRLQSAGLEVFAWDITTDVGIPAYAAAILERPDRQQWRPLGMSRGFGCHLSPSVALLHALSEAVQVRVCYVSGSRDDVAYADYERDADTTYNQELWDELQHPTSTCPLRPDRSTATLDGDATLIVEALHTAGIQQVAVVDLTHPDLGIPVVKVVIPGLEPISESKCLPGPRALREALV